MEIGRPIGNKRNYAVLKENRNDMTTNSIAYQTEVNKMDKNSSRGNSSKVKQSEIVNPSLTPKVDIYFVKSCIGSTIF